MYKNLFLVDLIAQQPKPIPFKSLSVVQEMDRVRVNRLLDLRGVTVFTVMDKRRRQRGRYSRRGAA